MTSDVEATVDQINVVVDDVGASAEFLDALGVKVADTLAEWMPHHRTVESTASGFGVDLDSSAFAAEWGGLPRSWKGIVLGVRVRGRGAVDAIYERALAAGATRRRAPYDAFWGARIAIVETQNGLVLALMSPSEEDARRPPPDPSTLSG